MLKLVASLVSLCFFFGEIHSQYIVNGNAFSTSCNCYTLTQAVNGQSGSVWNANQINLSQSFDFKFDIFLGCADPGADGMVFILQPISTAVGTSGGGLGFQGVTPSVGIMLDTYQNGGDNDPAYDHISINRNGNISHSSANNLAGPTQIISGNDDAEDCNWHVLRVVWNATTQQLTAYIDGVQRVQATVDLVNSIFSGNPNVYWGFTAATGGLNNVQKFCTRLNGQISNLAGTDTLCHPTTLNLNPIVDAFGPIAQYYWNMGDGTVYNTPSVSHNYATHGIYNVKFAVKGIDGCNSDTTYKSIIMGGVPVVAAAVTNACLGDAINFSGTVSAANFTGNVDAYLWEVDNVPVPNSNSLTFTNNQFGVGIHQVKFSIKTNYGCTSNIATTSFEVYPKPAIPTINVSNTCEGSNTVITSSNNSVGIIYGWLVDGVSYPNSNSISSVFAQGVHTVKHFLKNASNCTSDTATASFTVYTKPIANFNVNNACLGNTVNLDALNQVTGHTYEWYIDGSLVSTTPSHTINTLTAGNHIVKLIQKNGDVCIDSILKPIVIANKPDISASAPTVCLGQPSQFTATLNNAPMNIVSWQWFFPDGTTANTQNVIKTFLSEGTFQAKLVATNDGGCTSDTLPTMFTILKPFAFAGNDTTVVQNQPFLLNGAGAGNIFQWQPAALVSNASIAMPSVTLTNDQMFTLTVTDGIGCTATDSVFIKVFKGSNIFIPNAFTPNNDGKNDVLKPYLIGITKIEYFNVYNRWGQLIFNTSSLNGAWNGSFNGKQQPTGTYVWIIKATDFLGKEYKLKGVVTIIR